MSTPAIMSLLDPVIEALGESVDYPNLFLNKDALTQYLRVDYLESRPEQSTFGSDRIPSILQIRVYVKADAGNRTPLIQLVLDTFPKNTQFTSVDADIRIDRAATVGPSITKDGWHFVPISIPYEVYR